MLEICVRPAQMTDCGPLARLREALWPESSFEEHLRELSSILSGRSHLTMPYLVLVADRGGHAPIGFLEVGLRSHADGCDPSHAVGFIEGWYVAEGHRRQGAGRQLLAAAENWARDLGCVEMASDTWIDSDLSQRAHEALGYEVVDRCVHYRKAL